MDYFSEEKYLPAVLSLFSGIRRIQIRQLKIGSGCALCNVANILLWRFQLLRRSQPLQHFQTLNSSDCDHCYECNYSIVRHHNYWEYDYYTNVYSIVSDIKPKAISYQPELKSYFTIGRWGSIEGCVSHNIATSFFHDSNPRSRPLINRLNYF